MQQLGQRVAVRDARRHRVAVASFTSMAGVSLQLEVSLLALPSLVHLRGALAARVPGRRRCMEGGRVDTAY
jgi:hypothetical protein